MNGGSGSVWRVSGAVTDGPPPHLLVYDNIAEAPCRHITELEHLPFLCVCRFLFKGRGCNGGATDGGHNLANYFFFFISMKESEINQQYCIFLFSVPNVTKSTRDAVP